MTTTGQILSVEPMILESFSRWQFPDDLDGYLVFEDMADSGIQTITVRHAHQELELHFVVRGHAAFLIGDERVEAPAGTLVWFPPRCAHMTVEHSDDLRRWALQWRCRMVRRTLPRAGVRELLESSKYRLSRLKQADTSGLARVFAEVRSQLGEHVRLRNVAAAYALSLAYQAYLRGSVVAQASSLHPAVYKACQTLIEQVPPPDLEQLSRICAISGAHLGRLFYREVGVSITDFRNQCRLARFLQIYGDGRGQALMTAALEAGFGSYPQFHRVFRKIMGYKPARHRARLRGE